MRPDPDQPADTTLAPDPGRLTRRPCCASGRAVLAAGTASAAPC